MSYINTHSINIDSMAPAGTLGGRPVLAPASLGPQVRAALAASLGDWPRGLSLAWAQGPQGLALIARTA